MKKAMILLVIAAMLCMVVVLNAEQDRMVTGVYINPNPMEKYTVITVQCSQPTLIDARVETETGVVVKSLYCGTAGEQTELNWNRLGDDGSYTPKGKYVVHVIGDSRYTSTKKTLILK